MNLTDGHYFACKELPGDRTAMVAPLTYGRARLVVGLTGSWAIDDGWWYDTPVAAVAALALWDGTGEPTGWMRHPKSGRRRPDGDPASEYVYG